ncbi:MAG: Rne/Rng family ribonuclease [Calditrichae bacterium]|nr:Rne/Rng family ribonuclease [Calditrichota bacterium]MCB9057875.1 Rne/Rng family ribonuclease [Calditrichia bacterium]
MTKDIIINSTNEETRIVLREDNKVVELFVEAPEHERMVGDIYKGKVSRVLPGMQAAFIDIGQEQNAFLHFSDVSPVYQEFFKKETPKPEKEGRPNKRRRYEFEVERELKKGQDIMVQIVKEPISTKGCRVTSEVTVPGRFVVLIPNHKHIGISRKIFDNKERKRLKEVARQIIPANFGLIIRTVAEGKSDKELKKDINDLLATWHNMEKKIAIAESPSLIYKDMSMASSIIRDLFTSDIDQVSVDSRKMMVEISAYVKYVAAHLVHKINYYKGKEPIFDHFGVEAEIDKMLDSKVWLKNGGYIVIHPTEALVSIDVNSGKFIGKKDHESNSLKINLEAAREIARQARLRDLGGLIVIDFIDVLEEENKRKIFLELKKEFAKDRAITKIEDMSRFGLIEMTRQRVRPEVILSLYQDCPKCQGSGLVPTISTTVSQIERWIQRYRSSKGDRRISLHVTSDVYNYLVKGRYNKRLRLMWKYWMKINLVKDESLDIGEYKFFDYKDKKSIEIGEKKAA